MQWQIRDDSRLTLRRLLAETAALLAVACLLSAAAWVIRRPLPLRTDLSVYQFELAFPLISAADAVTCYQAGSHLFVDVREADFEAVPHIPGAFPIRLASFEADLGAVLDFIYPADAVILYGDGNLQTLAAVAEHFRERGYTNLSLLAAGFPAWEAAGGETSGGP